MDISEWLERELDKVSSKKELFECDCCKRNLLYWKNSNAVLMYSVATLYISRQSISVKKRLEKAFSQKREEFSEDLDDMVEATNHEIDYDENVKYCPLCIERECDKGETDCQDPIE